MEYAVNFGRLARPARSSAGSAKFRLALLGDFSGRANAGTIETGPALARRKPVRVDVDTLDDVIARFGLALSIDLDGQGGAVSVPIGAIDDFHPDQLAENVEIFAELNQLRRDLATAARFDRAAKKVLGWSDAPALPRPPRRARGAQVATDRRLSDFARLLDRPAAAAAPDAADASEALIERLVGPFVVPTRDARQDQLVARVDEALTAAMRRILHHPDVQAAEALWRGVELLVRRIETGPRCEIVLYDISAEELAADLAATDALEDTGLYAALIEQPALDAHAGPLSALIGLYGFEPTPPHVELLGRVAQLAAAAGAPFIAAIGPDALATPLDRQHELIQDSWAALTALPASAYLGLATPRFLLRLPYGRRTDPIDAFAFEEFSRQEGLAGMLWAHAAVLPALLLAQSWLREGAKMKPGGVLTADDMPYFVYPDPDGDQVALPCTERLYGEREVGRLATWRVMPILALRGRPEIRLAGFTSLAGTPLAGFWAPVSLPAPTRIETPVIAPPAAVPDEDAAGDDPPDASAAAPAATSDATARDAPSDAPDELADLLASLNAPAVEPSGDDATEPDLDALLASLGA